MNYWENKIVEIAFNDDDYKKCEEYLLKIKNGDKNILNEADEFTNNKFTEICITDPDVVLANKISKVTMRIKTEEERISNTINGLNSIKQLIISKTIKKIAKE